MNPNKVFLKSPQELLLALLADEAKSTEMLNTIAATVRQLQAKNSFQLAIINQLIETLNIEKTNKHKENKWTLQNLPNNHN